MKHTFYRIKYRVVTPGRVGAGERVIEVPISEYLKVMNKDWPDRTFLYVELVEEWEEEDESSTAAESVIILC